MNCETLYKSDRCVKASRERVRGKVRRERERVRQPPNLFDGVIKTEHWLFDIEKSRLVCWL
jgi:hypothetical protein